MNRKISVVMPYYNRKELLYRTLKSIEQTTVSNEDFEIIIVDDASANEHKIDFLHDFSSDIKLIEIQPSEKTWTNPCIPLNIGIKESKNEIIVLQNPECIHVSDILQYAQIHSEKNKYISFGCYSLDQSTTTNLSNFNWDDLNLYDRLKSFISPQNRPANTNGELGWYNHSTIRYAPFHFTSVIDRSDLSEMGGFDESYANGLGHEDVDFILRIRTRGIHEQVIDDIFSIHQWHYHSNHHWFTSDSGRLFKTNENLGYCGGKNGVARISRLL